MTSVKLTQAELVLLDRQRKQGLPHPADIFGWRKAFAAVIAAVEAELRGAEAHLDASL